MNPLSSKRHKHTNGHVRASRFQVANTVLQLLYRVNKDSIADIMSSCQTTLSLKLNYFIISSNIAANLSNSLLLAYIILIVSNTCPIYSHIKMLEYYNALFGDLRVLHKNIFAFVDLLNQLSHVTFLSISLWRQIPGYLLQSATHFGH